MELVVDANVLLASLIKQAVTRELLLDSRLKLYAPEHLISETLKHLKSNAALRKRIKLEGPELEELFYLLTQEIETIPQKSFASHMNEALSLAPHKEDAPYLALALSLGVPIWSNDKGFRDQTKVEIYTTPKLLTKLEKRSG